MRQWTIMQGNVIDRLRELPADSLHCCVTSPPYWGLRDYKIPPTVWGGAPECAHEWQTQTRTAELRRGLGLADSPASTRGGGHKAAQVGKIEASDGTCIQCGAWLGCLGLEPTPELFIQHMVDVFREIRRVLRNDGTLWLNMGDSYATGAGSVGKKPGGGAQGENWQGPTIQPNRLKLPGLKPKDLIGIPWMLAFALRADGWYLRSEIIWHKPNPMPESVSDRPTKAHEHLFLLTKRSRYFYDAHAVKEAHKPDSHNVNPNVNPQRQKIALGAKAQQYVAEGGSASRVQSGRFWPAGGRNIRTVWTMATQPFPEAHFATFPIALPTRCILAGTSEHGCCAQCGAPWERIVEPSQEYAQKLGEGKRVNGYDYDGEAERGFAIQEKCTAEYITKGWAPTCKCGTTNVIAATVLYPFNGAGTTGMAATRLNRAYIGIEIKPEYIEMATRRIQGDAPLFNIGQVIEPSAPADGAAASD